MPKAFSRVDRSTLGQWWWTVDHWILGASMVLLLLGVLLSVSASPMVAKRIGFEHFFFVKRHLMMIVPSIFLLVGTSLIPKSLARYVAWGVFALSLALLLITPIVGCEIKGSKRWISLCGFSLQASEFIKPTFAVISAVLFSKGRKYWPICMGLYAIIATFLMSQPDFGMTFVITGIWAIQLFVAGVSLYWIGALILGGGLGLVGAYFALPHVASRIDRFIGSQEGDLYQVTKSLEALKSGGLLGQGPGEGIQKRYLPDAHADFVFSVAGEEFGYFLCVFILLLYILIIGRLFLFVLREEDFFINLALTGLLSQYAIQILINIASSLHLIPTKGMTLPFLSYGGSSLLAVSSSLGLILSFTRKSS